MWVFFILEPVRLLGACKPGSRARMDSRTGNKCKERQLSKFAKEVVRNEKLQNMQRMLNWYCLLDLVLILLV